MMKSGSRAFAAFWGLPLFLWQAAFFVGPLIFLLVITFWSVRSFRMQPDFTFANWYKVLSTEYVWGGYFRSVTLSTVCALITTTLALPVAYLLSFCLPFRLRILAACLMIVPFFTSYLVRVYTWRTMLGENGAVNALLGLVGIPQQSMTNNYFGMMVGFVTLTLPLTCLLQTLSMSLVDRRLIEAAYNLGCKPMRTVFSVILPAAKPGVVLGAAFAFVLSFGDFVSPDLLGGRNPPTISLLIVDQVKGGSNWPRASVIAVMMMTTLLAVVSAATVVAYRGHKR